MPAPSPGGLSRGSGMGTCDAPPMPTHPPRKRARVRHQPAFSLWIYSPKGSVARRAGGIGWTNSYTGKEIASGFISQSIHITTGRKIAEGLPNNIDDVVVMLDADCAFKHVSEADTEIYWGTYLGTEDEILVSGNLRELADDIERRRKEAKARKGWIMDTYLLRRIGGTESGHKQIRGCESPSRATTGL